MNLDRNSKILKTFLDLGVLIGKPASGAENVISFNRACLQRQVKDQLDASMQVEVLLRANFNMLSPINCLPLELLGKVFRDIRADSKCYDQWLQFVTHVCVTWRIAAIQDASLWTAVEIGSIDMARTFIKRAGNMPLSFVYSYTDPSKHIYFMEMLQENVQRLKSLSLQNATGKLHYRLWEILHSSFPKLIELSIDMSHYSCSVDLSVYLQEGYKSLERLHLHGPFVIPNNLWRTLTYLSLSGASMFGSDQPELSLTEFLDLLEANPGLVKLKIKSANPKRGTSYQSSTRTFSMPNLRKLTMKSWRRGHIPDLIPYFVNHLVTQTPLVTKIPDCAISHLTRKRSSQSNDVPPNLRLANVSALDLEFVTQQDGILVFDKMNVLKGTIGNGVEVHLADLSKSLENVESVKITALLSLNSALVVLQHLHLLRLLKISTGRTNSLHLLELFEDLLISTDDWPNLEVVEIAEIDDPEQSNESLLHIPSISNTYPEEVVIDKVVSRPLIDTLVVLKSVR